jgi:hypothetical protein
VRARVLRQHQEAGDHVLNASFEGIGERKRAQVRALLERFAEGPAVLPQEGATRAAHPGVAALAEPATAAAPEAPPSTRIGVALDEQAARVLLGRELSLGGMRVDRDALLRVGQNVRLALHVSSLEAPLVVTARVHRDEGARGLVLRFHAISRDDTQHLRALLDSVPAVEPGERDEPGVVVSEILELAVA